MVIVAWTSDGSPAAVFDEDVFRSVLTIFITQAFLNLLQGIVDIRLTVSICFSISLISSCCLLVIIHRMKLSYMMSLLFSNFES